MSKVNQTKEEKFRQSLKSWGDDIDNRPMIRVKEDKHRDAKDRERVMRRVATEKEKIALEHGVHSDQVHLWTGTGPDELKVAVEHRIRIKED